MIVSEPKSHAQGNRVVVSAAIAARSSSSELTYTRGEGLLECSSEPFLVAALLPAMWLAEPLRVEGMISARLASTLPTIQDVFHSWDAHFQKIAVEARTPAYSPRPEGRGVACFFSGGVDSFYTVLKHQTEIDALIYVHGFDLLLQEVEQRSMVSRALRAASAELRKPLIEIETNIRDWLRPYVPWDLSHGAALASVALLLRPEFRKIYVASSGTYAQMTPYGSHPFLDPLWSTEDLEIVHDGCESTKVEKVARIADSTIALRYLRVCANTADGSYNCGRCHKCLRTKIDLYVAGALERCEAIDHTLDLNSLVAAEFPEPSRVFWEDSLAAAAASGKNAALTEAVRAALAKGDRTRRIQIEHLERELATTQAWARELEQMVITKDRQLDRLRKLSPFPRLKAANRK